MANRTRLTQSQVLELLDGLPGWSLSEEGGEPKSLSVEYSFKDFKEAYTFMTAVAFISEEMNHHPDWQNVYKKVLIHISTHDVGGVTELDFEWAGRVHGAFSRFI